MTDQSHTPLPWCADPDLRAGMSWNIHIVEEKNPHMRICFMSNGPQSEANAELIVRSVNAVPSLVKALEEIIKHVVAMRANRPSEGLDNIERIALNALSSYRGEGK